MTKKLPLNALDTASQTSLRDRGTHTGTQAISTVVGLQASLDTKAVTADLASTTAGKGAGLIGTVDGGTLATQLPSLMKYTPTPASSIAIAVKTVLDSWIFPQQYGAALDGTTDDSAAWQAAINASSTTGKPIFFPAATSVIDNVLIANKAQIRGSGRGNSIFKAKSGSTNPIFACPVGQVQGFGIRDVDFQGLGATNVGQPCLWFISQYNSATNNGGMWTCFFENIEIRGFDGISVGFKGATVASQNRPHQWITFKKVQVERARKESGYALYLTGQCEAFTFDTCRFDMNGSGIYIDGATDFGTNVYIGREFTSDSPTTGTAIDDGFPDMIKFMNCVCQQSTLGMMIDRCENVDVDTCRFEDLGNSVLVRASAVGIHIHGCRFGDGANVASTGSVLSVNSNAKVTYGPGNRILGTTVKSFITDGAGSIYMLGANIGGFGVETNVIPTLTIGSGTTQISPGYARGVYITANTTGIALANITSDLSPGEEFFLQVNPSSSIFTLVTGGSYPWRFNLGSGVTSITVNPGECHYFVRTNVVNGWNYKGKI